MDADVFPRSRHVLSTLELLVHIQNEEEMLSMFSTALDADIGFGRCYLFYQIKLVLINCMYKYCTFLPQCNELFLKVAHGFKWLYSSVRKVIFQFMLHYSFREKKSLSKFFKTPAPHKLFSRAFVLKIFEKYLGRSSILWKLHVCNLELY